MAVANLRETLLAYKLRRNQLNLEITQYQAQKNLALYSRGDSQSFKNHETNELREYYKALFDGDPDLQEKYTDYTEMPDFEAEIDKLTAKYQDEFDQLTAWETALDAQITTASAELEEVNAYMESIKSMLSSNIQEDFNYGLN